MELSEALEQAGRLWWYHSMELAPGHVTDGMFDLRPFVGRYGLPERMDGLRALDIGTWDGFWAFEMERRGAEVTALDLDSELDLDWPPRRRGEADPDVRRGAGFRLVHELRGSSVLRVERNLYDARPEDLGTFDLIFCGSVLMHLRDQLLALERIADLCRGRFICAEEYGPLVGLLPFPAVRYRPDRHASVVFWEPSVRTWRRMLWTAGFDRVQQRGRFRLRSRRGFSVRHVVLHAERDAGGGRQGSGPGASTR
ncbi:MAG TPA: class I SAM-dependent methyltransferase [Solirubrobacteraceae bacterium]|nr:class I SAM-dependent methyltransferase [Solirubrobacteraceae bacterium]